MQPSPEYQPSIREFLKTLHSERTESGRGWLSAGRAAYRKLRVEREFRSRCTAVGARITLERVPYILNSGRIIIGDDVQLSGSSDIIFSNIVRSDPELRIGNHTFIGHGCTLNAADSIVIGDQCVIAAGVRIQDFDGHPMDAERRGMRKPTPPEGIKPIRIGNVVWIGNNSIILKGVSIGDRAVVSAMSL